LQQNAGARKHRMIRFTVYNFCHWAGTAMKSHCDMKVNFHTEIHFAAARRPGTGFPYRLK
jgi:hypothetical protein